MFIFWCVMILVTIILVTRKIIHGEAKPKVPYFDSLNMDHWPPDEREEIKKIADFYGVRYVTQEQLQEYTMTKIGEIFAAMEGWNIWDVSIHKATGQFERFGRAVKAGKISVLSYGPKYKLAKMRGNTGVYITSSQRCSCPDYRKRKLPCKHMYTLALFLDGDTDKFRFNEEYGSLYGLTFALTGRFPQNGKEIREKISGVGGKWVGKPSRDCSALIVGDSPSDTKISIAKEYDMEILSADCIDDLFPSHKLSVAL